MYRFFEMKPREIDDGQFRVDQGSFIARNVRRLYAQLRTRQWGELKKRNFTHVKCRFSLVKAGRRLLPVGSDRGLNDMRCFRGGFTLGVHKIPFLEFSPGVTNKVAEHDRNYQDSVGNKRTGRAILEHEKTKTITARSKPTAAPSGPSPKRKW